MVALSTLCSGAASIGVQNPADLDAELNDERGTRWTDGPVWLIGWIDDGEFVVS